MSSESDGRVQRLVGRLLTGCDDLGDNQMADDSRAAVTCGDVRAVVAEIDRYTALIEAMDERMEGEGLDRCPKCGTFAQVQRFVAGRPCQDVCIVCQVTPN